jgi:hypothetical protein
LRNQEKILQIGQDSFDQEEDLLSGKNIHIMISLVDPLLLGHNQATSGVIFGSFKLAAP